MSNSTFVDNLLSGVATIDEYDDYVDSWHDGPGLTGEAPSLAHYLGLSDEEYAVVFRNPALVRIVAAARRSGAPLSRFMESKSELALAARTSDDDTTHELVRELIKDGTLPPLAHGAQ